MALGFTNTSSTRLVNSAPPYLSMYPYSIGMWVYPTTSGVARICWCAASNATATNWGGFGHSAASTWSITAQNTTAQTSTGGTVITNTWNFLIARFISATNRRLDVLQSDGKQTSIQNTTSSTPTFNTTALGCQWGFTPAQFFTGSIGEFWWSDSDIQPGGDAMDFGYLCKLAYGGPFSIERYALASDIKFDLRDAIREYHGLHDTMRDSVDDGTYYSRIPPQVWTSSANYPRTVFPHPPLPYWYANPNQNRNKLWLA